MLDWRRVQTLADGFQHLFPLFAVIPGDLDLDELVRLQAGADFLQHGVGQAGVADEHDRVERMGLGAQKAPLGGIES